MSGMRKLSRRDFLRLSAGIAGLAALSSACTPAAPPAAAPQAAGEAAPAAAPAQKTITVWWWTGPTEQAVVSEFQKAFPDIKVELTELGEAVYGTPKYTTAVAAGKGPDVAHQNRHTFRQFATRKLYRAIDDLFQRDGWKKEDFPPEQMKIMTWDGVLYGLPYQVGMRFFYWNRKHFEEAGLDPNTPPKDWTELEAFTAKLNKGEGEDIERFGFIPGFPPGLKDQLLIFAMENGGESMDEEGRVSLLDTDPWVEALEWVTMIYDKYCGGFGTVSGFIEGFAGQAQDAFSTQQISMTSYGDWMIGFYSGFPDLDYDGTPLMPPSPALAGQKVNWACDWSFVIDPNTKNVDPAWEFLKYAVGPEGFRAAATVGMDLARENWKRQELPGEPIYAPEPPAYRPTREMIMNEFYTKLPDRERKMCEANADAATWSKECGVIGGLAATELWVEMARAWERAVSHESDARTALADAKANHQKALDEAWKKLESGG